MDKYEVEVTMLQPPKKEYIENVMIILVIITTITIMITTTIIIILTTLITLRVVMTKMITKVNMKK